MKEDPEGSEVQEGTEVVPDDSSEADSGAAAGLEDETVEPSDQADDRSAAGEETEPGSDADKNEIMIEEPDEQSTESEGKQTGSVIDSGTCGDKTHWTVTGESGNYTLTISGTGSVSPGYDKAPWDKYKSQIKKAVVGEGITFLGSYTFQSL